MSTTTKTALDDWYSYERLSPKVGGDYEPGMLRQAEDNEQTARRQGGRVVRRFIDEDRSAYSQRRRPAFEDLMAGIRAGEIKRFAVQHPDRLYRKPKELEDLIELSISRGVIFATPEKLYDLSNADDRFAARILVAVAAKSSDDESRRTTRMHRQKAEQGLPVGTRPFGYLEDKITPHPVEAPLYQEAAARVLAGTSLRRIVLDWMEAGVKTSIGGTWDHRGLKRVLTSPRYAGLRVWNDQVVGKAVWPGLISEDDLRSLQAILNDPSRRTVTHRDWTYLLTGRIFCGRCGNRLVGRPNNNQRSYLCVKHIGGCGRLSRLADPTEAEVIARYLSRLVDGVEVVEPPTMNAAELRAEIAEIDEMLGSLLDKWTAKKITEMEWERGGVGLRERRAELTRELTTFVQPEVIQVIPTDEAEFELLDRSTKRAHLFRLVDRVTVHPTKKGPQWDPTKIEVRWRA